MHLWTAAMFTACDGRRTGLELHQHCREQGWLPADVTAEDFARFLGTLVSGGFLEIEGFKPPAAGE